MAIRRVLLVDDEPHIREIIGTTLELIGGWEVIVAENGAQAIEVARTHSPDLILLDVMMPDMDGPTTLGNLREDDATKHIPVIFITAKVRQSDIDRFMGMGALGVIAKPFDPMTLTGYIEQLLWNNAA
ncbi:response regulator [Dehalococcoides mccartyi]|nr:response regulator [Dehalococcoides mccartyi]